MTTTQGHLTRPQVDQLLEPIRPNRVFSTQGQSHVPAYDVAAHLTRMLGFGGWDKEILSLTLIGERETKTSGGKPAWAITYSCTLRLTIRDPEGREVAHWEDGACGSSTQPQFGEAHDMAMKSAISYALKRCAAFGLGDQFGLSLYNKGNTGALVLKTLVLPEDDAPAPVVDLESHITAPLSLGNDEIDTDALDEANAPDLREIALHTPRTVDPTDPFGIEDTPEVAGDAPEIAQEPPAELGGVRVAPTANKPAQPAKQSAARKRLQMLRKDCADFGMVSDDAFRGVLEREFGVTSSTNLTEAQVKTVVTRLQAKVDEHKAQRAA
jgi:hypothetical protein